MLRSLGVQTSTSAATYLGTATTRFIPTPRIRDILIHEAFRGFEVRHYLAVVVEGEGELVVVFPVRMRALGAGLLPRYLTALLQKLLPRLAILEEVWRGARACLFDREIKSKSTE